MDSNREFIMKEFNNIAEDVVGVPEAVIEEDVDLTKKVKK